MDKRSRDRQAAEAQLVAAECVVEAETKDHLTELIGMLAEKLTGDVRKARPSPRRGE